MVPLSEDVLVDVYSRHSSVECFDGDEFVTDDVCYSVREVCISFGVVAWSAKMGVAQKIVLFACFGVVDSLICCQLRMCCAESQ